MTTLKSTKNKNLYIENDWKRVFEIYHKNEEFTDLWSKWNFWEQIQLGLSKSILKKINGSVKTFEDSPDSTYFEFTIDNTRYIAYLIQRTYETKKNGKQTGLNSYFYSTIEIVDKDWSHTIYQDLWDVLYTQAKSEHPQEPISDRIKTLCKQIKMLITIKNAPVWKE